MEKASTGTLSPPFPEHNGASRDEISADDSQIKCPGVYDEIEHWNLDVIVSNGSKPMVPYLGGYSHP